jgi:hypothetical protein
MSSYKSNSSSSNSKSSSYESYYDEEIEDVKTADCIRNRSNFSMVKSFHMMDKKDFNPDLLNIYIENNASPKIKALMKKIKSLDEKDMKTSGKLYKHLIFTDVNRSAYGAKIIASALTTQGMKLIYHPQGKGFSIINDEILMQTKGNNFAVLLSKNFYDRPVNMKIRKAILEKYNSRPDNIYGDLIRFIILDQGFKEGIDLFDVKYVHLFEPLVVQADEKQAIGRATRFCGQKGLEFHPRYGWPLYVYKYDVNIPEDLQDKYKNSKTLFELYVKHSNLDMKKIIFASELENATINAAVDNDLTKSIHSFKVEKPNTLLSGSNTSHQGGNYEIIGGNKSKSPSKIMNYQTMKQFIASKYMRLRYPRMTLENNCKDSEDKNSIGNKNGNIVTFTQTQEFVRNYFQPESAYKGILLYHSVGTGKTCTAIATASTSFDLADYTILWVTRHTLKADIWKNMYGQVCNLSVQNEINKGLKLPNKITNKFKYISKNWLEPISYKQFSNMLLKKNKIYNEMVNRNGSHDPLKKTLLIIDEAHKLYSPTVAKSEKPDTDILEKMIQHSYVKSGKDSVRVMLMTATPFTEDGMEMIKLINLLKQDNHLPSNFSKFSNKYLDDNGYFTKKGLKSFQDDISGYVSYLNRSQDARNFAHPVIENVYVKLSTESQQDAKKIDKITKDDREQIKKIKFEIKSLKTDENKIKKLYNTSKIKECKENVKNNFDKKKMSIDNDKKLEEAKCNKLSIKERKVCKESNMTNYKKLLNSLKYDKEHSLNKCKDISYNDNKDSKMTKIHNKMKELNEELDFFNKRKDVIKSLKEKKKGVRLQIKELNNNKKIIQSKLKNISLIIKDKKKLMKHRLKTIRSIKDKQERKLAMKEFRLNDPLVIELKDKIKEYKELRANSSKLNSQASVLRLSSGIKVIKNISQDYALNKFCKM